MELPNLVNCLDLKEGERSDCYLASGSDRAGYVVYQNYRGCLNSWLAAPGFMLLPTWGLAILYLLILLYMFVGVALASDRFMDGIEVICSATRSVKQKCRITGEVKIVQKPVWNWVVANVSLMAVGTSAPEILLAVVESILRLGRPAGELGPSTIVGSAAYNLMMIAAVCTASLPVGVVKRVQHLRVFVTTAIISLWAYVWMLVVYLWWTPSEVTVIEAVLTLVQFALMLIIAWAVDVQFWTMGRRGGKSPATVAPDAIVAIDAAGNLEAGMGGVKLDVDQLEKPKTDANNKQPEQHPPLLVAWRQQFAEAIEYDSKAAEDGEEAGGVGGLIMHFLSIFWKLVLATVPPAWWMGGWPTFFMSLLWIVAQVIVIDESATLLGCVVGLSPLVIGMSLVAMGTSLPDTFCSRAAALKDKFADAAVGNITGSNASNVFLGLGLPWLISSCYYAVRGERFCSDSGALAFSVLVFSGAAVIWLAVLFARRRCAGGELGANSAAAKWSLLLLALCLWVSYLTLTGLVSEGRLSDGWIAVQAGSNACFPGARR